ncbi:MULTISPECIES: hypothetical protein [Haloferacaceae]|uniref:Uncharacterized protein n=1 Tax=Halorubrum glutamatedens TaxID=2707018 RepID=A0ABD5QWF6_9EURY|nr:hypothetical protein [Halobellus captivus]
MPSRRSLLGRLGTVGLLGTSIAGLAAGSAAGSTPGSVATTGRNAPYDASRLADGDTTLTATVDPAAVSTVGLPKPWSTRLSAATARADVSLSEVDSISGSVALSGETVEGAAVVRGSFDSDRLVAAVQDRGRWSTVRTRTAGGTGGSVRRFRGREEPYAVAVSDAELVVGYAPTVDRAAAHVRAGVETGTTAGTDAATRTDATVAGNAPIPSLLSGDVVVYADLGESGRSRLRAVLSGAPEALRASVEAAGSIGVAVGVDGGIGLRYAATLDPARLTRGRLRRISGSVDSGGVLDDATVGVRGRTVVVDATTTREELFSLHDDLRSARVDAVGTGSEG